MNLSWAHVHLLLNHFPIVGAIIALMIFIVGLARRSKALKQTSYWTFFLMALTAIAVFYSGTQAVQAVEGLPNVTEAVIHRHREVGEWSLIGIEIAGALGLAGILLYRRAKLAPAWFNITFLGIAIAATTLVFWAGLHGGTIRHTEIRGELNALMLSTESFEHEDGDGHDHSEAASDGQPAEPSSKSSPDSASEETSDGQSAEPSSETTDDAAEETSPSQPAEQTSESSPGHAEEPGHSHE